MVVNETSSESSGARVVVERAASVDDDLVESFERLIPQLSSSSPPPTREHLAALVASPDTVLFLARLDGRIVGSLTLAFYRIPTGLKSWIEDVVVDEEALAGPTDVVGQALLELDHRQLVD